MRRARCLDRRGGVPDRHRTELLHVMARAVGIGPLVGKVECSRCGMEPHESGSGLDTRSSRIGLWIRWSTLR